ncbi:hypothetical protein EDD18DRAFT_90653 [Armillaria luteobubalina]|uniref:Uncharacterized protein n=1 Tax=Armillaria luteobubalina TaxID=153913 RepID=A0AA39Q9L0_9AGAR|nr:hypothetical protein EDD18DRAFT_90653 [Armillaria luteobubalina]
MRSFLPRRPLAVRRRYSTQRSPHAQWYADLLPAMVPIALLGSAVYLGLQLVQTSLSHEKFLDDANRRVKELEAEVESLHAARQQSQQPSVSETPSQSPKSPTRWRFW